MLIVSRSDTGSVLYRALVTVAVTCCGLVIISFGLFALDQVSGASSQQVQLLDGPTPGGSAPGAQTQEHQPRRFIDSAARTLTSPFSGVISSDSAWAQRTVAMLVALLIYGFGLGYLARYSRGMS